MPLSNKPHSIIRSSDGCHVTSYYAASAGDISNHPSLDVKRKADVCIIGGGFTGLSAAVHLAEQGLDVVLLEAEKVGWGASGRNGGHVGVGPRVDAEVLADKHARMLLESSGA